MKKTPDRLDGSESVNNYNIEVFLLVKVWFRQHRYNYELMFVLLRSGEREKRNTKEASMIDSG